LRAALFAARVWTCAADGRSEYTRVCCPFLPQVPFSGTLHLT